MNTKIKVGIVWLVGYMVSFIAPIILFSTLIIPQTLGAVISVFTLVVCGAICLYILRNK